MKVRLTMEDVRTVGEMYELEDVIRRQFKTCADASKVSLDYAAAIKWDGGVHHFTAIGGHDVRQPIVMEDALLDDEEATV